MARLLLSTLVKEKVKICVAPATVHDLDEGRDDPKAYAMIQHEREDFRHSKPGRMAKYLKKPFDALSPGIIAKARRKVKGDLRRKR